MKTSLTRELCLNNSRNKESNYFSPFIKLPYLSLEKLLSINPLASKLYLLLLSYSDGAFKGVYPSEYTLARRMGLCRQTISALIGDLRDVGLITVCVKRKFNGTYGNYYEFKRFEGEFIKLPREIIDDDSYRELSGREILLYLLLRTYSDAYYNPCNGAISTTELARMLRVSRQSVSGLISSLSDKELIYVERTFGLPNKYSFIINGSIIKDPSNTGDMSSQDTCKASTTWDVKSGRHAKTLSNESHKLESTTELKDTVDVVATDLSVKEKTLPTTNTIPINTTNELLGDTITNKPIDAIKDYVSELTHQYEMLLSQLRTVPKNNDLFSPAYVDYLKCEYDAAYVDLTVAYCGWMNAKVETVRRPKRFIMWALMNSVEMDYGEYFCYLKRLISREQRVNRQKEIVKIKMQEQQDVKDDTVDKQELAEFLRGLKGVAGGKRVVSCVG